MTILFFSSFAVMVSMILFKGLELKLAFVSNTMKFFDNKAHQFRLYVEKKVKLYKKIAYLFIFDFIPAYLYEKSVSLKDYLYKKYYESAVSLKGNRKILKSSGSVSSFLQEIKLEKPDEKEFVSDVLISGEDRSIKDVKNDAFLSNKKVDL